MPLKPSRPWHYSTTTLAMKIGSYENDTHSAIGWALLENCVPDRRKHGDLQVRRDAVSEAVALWKKEGRPDQPVAIYTYTKATFHLSQAAKEGMTLEAHSAMVEALRVALTEAGATVEIKQFMPYEKKRFEID